MSIDFNTCLELASGNIRTPKARLSYPNLETPNPEAKITSGKNAGKCKYTLSLLIPKTANIDLLRAEANAAAVKEFGEQQLRAMVEIGKFNTPFLDAFEKSKTINNPAGDDRMQGFWLLRVDSHVKPGVVEANGQPIGDDYSGVYAGRWGFATLSPLAYPAIDGGKPGVKFWLANVQLLDHDERLGGGRVAAESEFTSAVSAETGEAVKSTDSVFGGTSVL